MALNRAQKWTCYNAKSGMQIASTLDKEVAAHSAVGMEIHVQNI